MPLPTYPHVLCHVTVRRTDTRVIRADELVLSIISLIEQALCLGSTVVLALCGKRTSEPAYRTE